MIDDTPIESCGEGSGTEVDFIPDKKIFKNYKFRLEYVERMVKNYVYLNPGLVINLNGNKFSSKNGLKDLLEDQTNSEDLRYPIIHLVGNDIEVALTHSKSQYSEQYYSFVNGQHTTQGGTHHSAFREAIVKTVRDHFGKNYDASDIRKSIIAAVSIKVMEPIFESQTKTIRKWIKGIVKEALIEWEQEVEYLGRTGYKWENNQWVPTETQPLRLDEIQE